uniref:Uncharacterized protein n=1 Tax=Rhizobium leguminosarum TaxID=384 RepID=A0A179BCD9_RHILE|nr:hypothetical protein A4U53_32965 [Rhizobium leguminosarum]
MGRRDWQEARCRSDSSRGWVRFSAKFAPDSVILGLDPRIHAASTLLAVGTGNGGGIHRRTQHAECCAWILGSSPRMTEVEGSDRQEAGRQSKSGGSAKRCLRIGFLILRHPRA